MRRPTRGGGPKRVHGAGIDSKNETFTGRSGREEGSNIHQPPHTTQNSREAVGWSDGGGSSCAQNSDIDKIKVGMNVNIQRSDGRIHGALVTNVSRDNLMVAVEWFEMSETKGKNIELRAIIRNNMELFQAPLPPPVSNSIVVKNNLTPNQSAGPSNPKPVVAQKKFLPKIDDINEDMIFDDDVLIEPMAEAGTENIDKVTVGMSVNIQRSDGRVHGALVTNVSRENSMISVEWFEMGETKGKDIEVRSIIRNNLELFKAPSLSAPSNSNSQTVVPKNNVPVRYSNIIHSSAGPSIPKPVVAQKKVLSKLEDIKENGVLDDQFLPEAMSEIGADVKENEPLPPPPSTSQNKRRTRLLTNIEDMERNRELRRAQQGEARKQRELQKEIDPGNPNWEFLSMIRDYQAQLVYRPLRFNDPVVDNRICVCVRKRPLSKKELMGKEVEVVSIPSKDHVIVHQPQTKVDLTKYLVNQRFKFDYTFNENSTNELVYKFSAQPLVRTIFQRGFATCFAYGQTGSGKTHTMGGVIEGKRQDCSAGVYAMTAMDVFTLLHSREYRDECLTVSCSFFEIYGTMVFDLLSKKAKLRILEDAKHVVQVVGLKEVKVHCVEDVLKLIKIGSNQRTAGQTSANSNSSRSHAVFQIILRKREKTSDALYGKFSLIDLAGNERGADTISSDRQTRLEGAEINKSLLALKECIRAMGRDEQHIPFRGSKLTLILRDSFVGKNAKTCMIAMISPGISSVENTMNTLRYADRVKELDGDRDDPVDERQPGSLKQGNDDEFLWSDDDD